ncbi:MAG TPA: 4Fe-4S ferredoxin [Firmicutes bacterium]|nr:4Fe-4S ferredoxin [Bacillota bacterium]
MRYDHLLKINADDCIGCTRCMRVCPTEAIRIVDGKVRLSTKHCVECGECLLNCHCHAFVIKGDEYERLSEFKYNIAILPIAIYGMVKEQRDMGVIFETLTDLGFDEVFETSTFYELLSEEIEVYINEHDQYPYILTQCPSMIKFVQTSFPDTSSKFLPFDLPFEVCAKYLREIYAVKLKLNQSEIGISYISECLANLQAIKQPLGKLKSNIDLVFLLSTIFKDILQHLNVTIDDKFTISKKGILWSKVGALRRTTNIIDYLSVDGISQVGNILEKVELGQLNHIKIIECYACIGGCVGGTFTLENPFVAKTKVNALHETLQENHNLEVYQDLKEKLNKDFWLFSEPLEGSAIKGLAVDFFTSLIKLQQINDLYAKLPKIDCCACGSPSCRALAEDVANGIKQMEDCVVLNRVNGRDTDESKKFN